MGVPDWNAALRIALVAALLAPGVRAREGAPNVLLVLVDDLKPTVLGFEGDPVVRTPNLDRLAEAGTSFSRAYVPLPQCGPSRAALLVGRYPHETGSTTNPGRWNPEHATVAQLLAERGYRTGMIGKWHLQDEVEAQAGFESWCALSRDFSSYHDPVFWIDGERRSFEGFLPDVVTDRALEFLDARPLGGAREASGDEVPEDGGAAIADSDERPFFLWLAYKAPHEPWTMPLGERFAYDRRAIPLPASLDDDLAGKPSVQREGDCHAAFLSFKNRRRTLRLALVTYYAMVTSIDENVGRLVRRLEERGELANTLVLFLSDNGYLTGEHQMFTKGPSFYEELVRTPLLVHWPEGVPAGQRLDALASTLDVLPTLARVAGASVPDGLPGHDLLPLLRGEVPAVREELFFEYERKLDQHVPMLGVVTPGSKYVRYLATEEEELYDLVADPLERTNLAGSAEHRPELERLRERVDAFRGGIEVPFW